MTIEGEEPLKAEPDALAQMKERGGTWAAYQNIALDSADRGRIQFIKYGPGCTFEKPPEKCPDTKVSLGWKYAFVGLVDLETGLIKKE